MKIKEEVIKLLTEWNLSKSDNDRMNYFDATGITTGLLYLFEANKSDAEKKLEKVKEYCSLQEDEDAHLDNDDVYMAVGRNEAKQDIINILLTATKLEGEK